MSIDEVWEIIENHKLKSMVDDIWIDSGMIMISVKSTRTGLFVEQLFENSNTEVMTVY
jgi:hypothetical protein